MACRESIYRFDAGKLGHIEGLKLTFDNKPDVHYFGGIPYALPPTGKYRFRVPRSLPKGYEYGTAVSPGDFRGGTRICPQPPCRNPPDRGLFDEDCLQLNIWIPAGTSPMNGWPVCIYFHGGFLQWGSANWQPASLAPLLQDSSFRAILVLPSYRLNAFGFLSSEELAAEARSNGEPVGNMGLWDQRAALEWTHANISYFGGDGSNITVSGYSAGGYSAFQQLAHELYCVPPADAIIRRIAMFSNGPGVTPKTMAEQQAQFDEFITRLGISLTLPAKAKLEMLRDMPYVDLIEAQSSMKISEFRLLDDGDFYPRDLMTKINNGDFGKRMKQRGITLLNGECRDEHTMYRNWRPPEDSYDGVYTRFCAEYPKAVVQRLMTHYCGVSKRLPSAYDDWKNLFGHIYATMQVHGLERGFHDKLFKGGLVPGVDVLRYRFDRRAECVDESIPIEWGVTHSSDIPIWFWGANFSEDLTAQEKRWLKGWNDGFAAFVKGQHVEWGPREPREMRRWRSDGETDTCEDVEWDNGLEIWHLLNDA